jgi:predicted methyltransferase
MYASGHITHHATGGKLPMKKHILLSGLALILAACGQDATDKPIATTEPDVETVTATVDYAAALASTTRLEGDHARDAGRKPDKVLEFLGVGHGMSVLDMFSGGGYYTEILASVVGEDGHVVSHSNEAYLNFVGEEFTARHADGRMPNVSILMAENNELQLPEGKFDAIMMVLNYHDLYYVDAENGWAEHDVPKFLAELKQGLKDDGFIGVVDHYAAAGSGSESGGTVHRIDPAIVVADMEAAGFICDAETDLLRNPADDTSINVFAPEIRGKTDRFVMRFVKAD